MGWSDPETLLHSIQQYSLTFVTDADGCVFSRLGNHFSPHALYLLGHLRLRDAESADDHHREPLQRKIN